jgi:hypothetical protein
VDDFEDAVGIGNGGIEENVEQPSVVRRLLAAGGGNALAALKQKQGIARDGVHRLHAAVDEDGKVAEAGEVCRVLGWQPQRDDLDLIVRSAIDWERKLPRLGWR